MEPITFLSLKPATVDFDLHAQRFVCSREASAESLLLPVQKRED
jgi:hypothetical protein